MPKFKVVITDFGLPDNDLEEAELRASGLDLELVRLNARTREDLLPHVRDADGLIVQFAKIDRPVLEAMTRCKVISRYGIGVDMVDLVAAGERGIMVCNVPDYCIEEVSTHTMGFLLALNRNLVRQNTHVHAGKWGGAPGPMPVRLSKSTLGIVGLGKIGRAVAQKAGCLGLKLIAFDPYATPQSAAEIGVELVAWAELLRRSDYVTVHCPLTEETHHLVGKAQLAMMKPTAYLINMSRGPVVDQQALYEALRDQVIAGAALDVLEAEPPAPDEPLLKLDNVLITPHSSSGSTDSTILLRRETAQNVVVALQGKEPRSVVNRTELRAAQGRGR